MPTATIADHALRPLVAPADQQRELRDETLHLKSWDLAPGQVGDLELLLNGAFSPLAGYLGEEDHRSVCRELRLSDGEVWPIPINLDVSEEFAATLREGERIALRHPEGMVLAVLTVSDCWRADRDAQARAVFGTTDESHPGVFELLQRTRPVYLGGRLEGLQAPPHYTFKDLRHTPEQLRDLFRKLGWRRVVGFQTRNPLHRAHVELTRRAAEATQAKLLIHPVVGRTSPGDVDYFSRVRCYQAVMDHYRPGTALLSLLPLNMRMAGPREAVWHAVIRRNYGCTHFIVGRDHAGPGKDRNGWPFYEPDAARRLAEQYADDIGIEIVSFEEMVYCADLDSYLPASEAPPRSRVLSLSGSELRRILREGREAPEWFSYPEVVGALRSRYPARSQQGFTVFFTGLSGAGKSTIANALVARLMEIGTRPVTLLDGDIVRKNLSSELGFSREQRDLNIRRIGFVAGEITKNRGVAVCAPIAPYQAARREVREAIGAEGGFIEVYVSTPVEVCETRDRKGLYAKARAGLIRNFTGVDDPYEAPESPELVIDAATVSAEDAVGRIIDFLEREGYLAGPAEQPADQR